MDNNGGSSVQTNAISSLRTNDAFNKPLAVAQSIAKGVNVDFGTTVVRFVQREIDFIDRIICSVIVSSKLESK